MNLQQKSPKDKYFIFSQEVALETVTGSEQIVGVTQLLPAVKSAFFSLLSQTWGNFCCEKIKIIRRGWDSNPRVQSTLD